MPEKTEREDPAGFSNIHSVAKLQKIDGGPFGGKKFEKKSHSAETPERGDSLVSSGIVCIVWETFLVQFLGPTVQFGVF